MPRRKKPASSSVPGLTRRGNRAYYHRVFPEAVGGDRIYRTLEAVWDTPEATRHALAVGTFWDRGDWGIIRRWADGDFHISELVKAVREGAYDSLRRLHSEGYLLGRAVEEHLERIEAIRRSGTIRNHTVVCKALIEHFGADTPMHEITSARAENFLHEAKETTGGAPWSSNTQKHYRMVASALWNFIIAREAEEAERKNAVPTLTRNPWSKAEVMGERPFKPNVLTDEERNDLLYHEDVKGTPGCTLVALAFLAGLRQQEATNLRTSVDVELWPESKWTDVLAGYLHIQSRKGDQAWDTKTDNSDRRVPIVPRLGRILLEHIERGYAGRSYLLRPIQADKPISGDTAVRWTRGAYEAAGIRYGRDEGEGLTLHSGRHSCATTLLSNGVSIAVVAEWLGDTQETVLKTYSHALPRDRELALKILEEA